MSNFNFNLKLNKKNKSITVEYDNLYAIGYAGRNIEKTIEHIKELEEELGVSAPSRIPTIFHCSNNILTFDDNIQVIGEKTCGEAEYVIVIINKKIYIGLGSDHTDRELESVSVLKSKQICPKPISRDLWCYDEVKNHWDQIKIISYQMINGEEAIYQEGTLGDILPVETILEEISSLEAKVA